MGKSLLRLLFLLPLFSMNNSYAAITEDSDPIVIIDQNFDAFTEGSVEVPGTIDISSYASGKLSATLPSWKGSKVYEAGGSLLIAEKGYLQTPYVDLSVTQGLSKISFQVKTKADYGDIVSVNLGYSAIGSFELNDNEWHTITLVTDKGSSYSYLKFSSMLEGFFIDDLKVEKSMSFIAVPEVKQPTDADGTSFTAKWSKVTGAVAYLLDVYTKTPDNQKVYLTDFENKEVTSSSSTITQKVTGLSPDNTYYFTVRAKNENGVSDHSEEIEVVEYISSLEAPEVIAATNVTSDGFTANWNQVAKAKEYSVNLLYTELYTELQNVEILKEDFSGITKGSISAIEFPDGLREYLDEYTTLPGWYTYNHCYANGYLGLYPFGDAGYLLTPALDLSKDNGVFVFNINMAETKFGSPMLAGAEISISLLRVEEEEETVVEEQKVILEDKFKDYSVSFTKGFDGAYIKVSYSGSNKLFIDDISISQKYAAGESSVSLVKIVTTDDITYDFEMTPKENSFYSYQVKASVPTVDFIGEFVTVYSPLSEIMKVEQPTDVESVNASANSVYVNNGKIVVYLDENAEIEVYDITGRLLLNETGMQGENTINLQGMLIVKIGEEVFKVIL